MPAQLPYALTELEVAFKVAEVGPIDECVFLLAAGSTVRLADHKWGHEDEPLERATWICGQCLSVAAESGHYITIDVGQRALDAICRRKTRKPCAITDVAPLSTHECQGKACKSLRATHYYAQQARRGA